MFGKSSNHPAIAAVARVRQDVLDYRVWARLLRIRLLEQDERLTAARANPVRREAVIRGMALTLSGAASDVNKHALRLQEHGANLSKHFTELLDVSAASRPILEMQPHPIEVQTLRPEFTHFRRMVEETRQAYRKYADEPGHLGKAGNQLVEALGRELKVIDELVVWADSAVTRLAGKLNPS